mmetsp:Transcript_15888/g.55331  ORF Transcript_15888/g.55331 Transcript_15888/m.55331 type:complete len:115 (+) Transcript_15888:111-455(+)
MWCACVCVCVCVRHAVVPVSAMSTMMWRVVWRRREQSVPARSKRPDRRGRAVAKTGSKAQRRHCCQASSWRPSVSLLLPSSASLSSPSQHGEDVSHERAWQALQDVQAAHPTVS